MARMFTDYKAISRKIDKELQFRSFVQSFVDRKIEELKNEGDRNKWAEFFLEYLAIQKMYGYKVNELYTEMREVLRYIQRCRNQHRDPNRLQDDYEHFAKELERYDNMRLDQATWLISVAQLMDDANIRFNENQLQTALSIPVKAWNRLVEAGMSPFAGGCSA